MTKVINHNCEGCGRLLDEFTIIGNWVLEVFYCGYCYEEINKVFIKSYKKKGKKK